MSEAARAGRTFAVNVWTYRVAASLLALAVFGLSLLTKHWKIMFHTRGPLHVPLHCVTFAMVTVMALRSATTRRGRYAMLAGAWLLGIAIEFSEAWRFNGAVEQEDILVDTLAVLGGWMLSRLLPGDPLRR